MNNKSAKHWLIVVLMCGLAGSSVGICCNTVGVFFRPVSEDLGLLQGTFAFHSTLTSIAIGITALFIPALVKRFSYKYLLITGVLAAALSTVGMAYSKTAFLFDLFGAIRGLGAGLYAMVPISMTINNWFQEKNGIANSLALSFSGLVGAVCSPVLSVCIDRLGWSNAYLIQAALIVLIALPAVVYPYSLKPQPMGLLPYGSKGEQEDAAVKTSTASSFRFLSVSFIVFCLFTFLLTSITGIGQHMTSFAQSISYPAAVGATMVSCAMVGNIASKLMIGWLSDRFTPLIACLIMIVTNIVALFTIFLGGVLQLQFLLYAGALIYGSIYSAGAVGVSLLTRYFFGTENFSSVYSKVGLVLNIGGSVSLTLIGYVYDFTQTYTYVFFGAAALQVVNILLLLFVVKKAKGKKQKKEEKKSLSA